MKARRGDLAVIVEKCSYRKSGTTVEIATVTSITREGVVKAYLGCSTGQVTKIKHKGRLLEKVYVIGQDRVDVSGAAKAARDRKYPGHEDSLLSMPFDTVDEAKEFLRPFLKG